MTGFYVPTKGANDWKGFLAEPGKQWKKGFSARSLAHSWEEAKGFPKEVRELFQRSKCLALEDLELLLALPEYKVPLPGGKRASQNDIFVLAGNSKSLVTIAVEGKVDEMFGPTLGEWFKEDSEGKKERLQFLSGLLNVNLKSHPDIRYQLVHRTASALILARSFHAKNALMLVHSFSQGNAWFE
ncbi:MAG: hypothetical protein JXR72_00125, partial [Proteobacteria bacterium]|nr:hypothetical protein [Pseudomonadota bacterium]